jgi:hypothetical protein
VGDIAEVGVVGVFAEPDVADPVHLVLDSPVAAYVGGDLGCGAGQAGDAVQDVFADALAVGGA